jgi:hypothetical protein
MSGVEWSTRCPGATSKSDSELRADRPAPALDAFDEFRNLCLLVTLVTALNDPHNRSTLTLTGTTPKVLSKNASVLHAMASILVLDHEILACMSEADDKASPSKTLLVTSMGSDTAGEHGDLYDMDVPEGKVKVTTIANSDERDLQSYPYGSCVSRNAGTDHWLSIMRPDCDGWYFLDK